MDAVIREDMGKAGNFNGIINMMAALQQEDPELYEMCMERSDQSEAAEAEAVEIEREKKAHCERY